MFLSCICPQTTSFTDIKSLWLLKSWSRHEQLPATPTRLRLSCVLCSFTNFPDEASMKTFVMSSFDKQCVFIDSSAVWEIRDYIPRPWLRDAVMMPAITVRFYLHAEAFVCYAADCRRESQILWQLWGKLLLWVILSKSNAAKDQTVTLDFLLFLCRCITSCTPLTYYTAFEEIKHC